MFERVSSLWRKLLHRPTPDRDTAATGILEDERRVWVRYACDLPTQCLPTNDNDAAPLAARIVDISLAGAKLLVGQPIEPGKVISLELPTAGATSGLAVLACVVHATEQDDGRWALGCTFSQELDDASLRAFGAAKVRPRTADKRTWSRFPTRLTALCRFMPPDDLATWPAEVVDLSATGVGLRVEQDIANGSIFTAELRNAHGHALAPILVCVVHVRPEGEGRRFLGCNFIRELTEKDFRMLL